jgi:4-amino-4-deoxy-L-arabinose transferase-like glycosyltransferase
MNGDRSKTGFGSGIHPLSSRDAGGQDSLDRQQFGKAAGGTPSSIQIAVLVAITLFGAAIRFYDLGEWSLWIDEIYTIDRARTHVNLTTILREWWHPSLSVILTGLSLKWLGVSEFTARLGSALIGIVSIPVLYVVVRRLLGAHIALLSAGLLAVSTWHLEWSQSARYFTSLALLYVLALFAFFLAWEGRGWRYVVAFYVLTVLALGERFIAASLGPVIVVYVLLLKVLRFPAPAEYRGRYVAALLVPGIAVVAIDLARLLVNGESFFLSWAALTYDRPISSPLSMAVMITRAIGVPLVVLGAFAGFRLVMERNRPGLLLFTSAVVPIALVLLLNPLLFTKDRFAFVTLPGWIALAATAVWFLARQTDARARIMAIGLAAALFADAMSSNAAYFRVNNGHRLDWRRAFGTVEALAQPNDAVVAWWPEFGRYYTTKQITPWADIDSTAVLDSGRAYWFVLDGETINGNRAMRLWVEREARLIAVYYLQTGRSDYLRVYRYEPRSRTALRDSSDAQAMLRATE